MSTNQKNGELSQGAHKSIGIDKGKKKVDAENKFQILEKFTLENFSDVGVFTTIKNLKVSGIQTT